MSDFVITGEQLHDFIRLNESGIKRLQDEIRSHPLASALEESYKNGFNDGQAEGLEAKMETAALDVFNWMKPLCFGRHEATCDTRCAWSVRKRCVKSLRSEP